MYPPSCEEENNHQFSVESLIAKKLEPQANRDEFEKFLKGSAMNTSIQVNPLITNGSAPNSNGKNLKIIKMPGTSEERIVHPDMEVLLYKNAIYKFVYFKLLFKRFY